MPRHARPPRRLASRRPGAAIGLWLCLWTIPGCDGGISLVVVITASILLAAVIAGRDRERRALLEAETLRRAISTGQHRAIEAQLRRELAAAATGEPIPADRQWLARAQLGGLLVAEWRLEEAAEVYGNHTGKLSPHLQALAAFGHHELAVLSGTPDETMLATIRHDRVACLRHVPATYQQTVSRAWDALEGLCLARMRRPAEALELLERGLDALGFNPARIVYQFHLAQAYEQLGDHVEASRWYEQAASSFPGTRLASEARTRCVSLRAGPHDASFRRMLPESPAAAPGTLKPRRST
ncbi:MAG: tetratricopeptide repeat protein [Myxococcales bacterium]|nr:tetratricopeptide repeat protein [Myxococcales bacterium]MCB9750261.1 tetratricopeptide repeat protein [Myxococcales bacterium]